MTIPMANEIDHLSTRGEGKLYTLFPGEPCGHPGCLSHVSHPCEGCGRIEGQPVKLTRGANVREKIAELMHEMWSGWMRYLFAKCKQQSPGLPSPGGAIIPPWATKRWWRRSNTPYDELSEGEKDSDRKVADKVLALIGEYRDVSDGGLEPFECKVVWNEHYETGVLRGAVTEIEDGTDCEEPTP